MNTARRNLFKAAPAQLLLYQKIAEMRPDLPGGVMGGVFGSGSSDYIQSLERLRGLNSKILLSEHGRLSDAPRDDVRIALQRSHALLSDTAAIVRRARRALEF